MKNTWVKLRTTFLRHLIGMSTLVIFAGLLNISAVRKKDDPILKTQTDPILYKTKMEEIKDGEKGAPSPSYKHYPEEKFLADPPYEKESKEGQAQTSATQGEDLEIPEDEATYIDLDEDLWEEVEEEEGEGEEAGHAEEEEDAENSFKDSLTLDETDEADSASPEGGQS